MPRPDERKIAGIMEKLGVSAPVTALESTDSTNLEAKRYARAGGRLPAVITADSQTAGRGRLGRSFYSPSSTGVYMSVVMDAGEDISSTVTVTAAAAVAAALAIEETTGLRPGIKWVNDLYLEGKKVCGILAESFMAGDRRTVIVGVGINVDTGDFPPELRDIAASLGVSGIRDELAARTAARIIGFAKTPPAELMDEYRRRSIVLGREITFIEGDGTETHAVAESIDDRGGLVAVLRDGTRRVLFTGEISLRLR